MRGISWIDIQMMLSDMPYTDYSSDKEKEEIIEVTSMEQHLASQKKTEIKEIKWAH